MLLTRMFTKLLALPFDWLGQIFVSFFSPLSLPFFQIAWFIHGDGRTALAILQVTSNTSGAAAALGRALAWMQHRPCVEIAAFGGLLALECDDIATATSLLARAKELGKDEAGYIETLEWSLARSQGPDATREFARRIESHRDLPPPLTRAVLSMLVWDALDQRRFDEVARRATHLLAVEDDPEAELALWALAVRDGRDRDAAAHLARAKMPLQKRLHLQLVAYNAIGRPDLARQTLLQLVAVDATRAGAARSALVEPAKEPA